MSSGKDLKFRCMEFGRGAETVRGKARSREESGGEKKKKWRDGSCLYRWRVRDW